jgi:hypothetical protein
VLPDARRTSFITSERGGARCGKSYPHKDIAHAISGMNPTPGTPSIRSD